MCHDFYYAGANLEDLMNVSGQFHECDEKRNLLCYETRFKQTLAPKINDKVASCAVYSLTFSAWFFVALRFAFHVELDNCALYAGGAGIALTALSFWVLTALTATPKKKAARLGAPAELGVQH